AGGRARRGGTDAIDLDQDTFPRIVSGAAGLTVTGLTHRGRAQPNAALTDSRPRVLLRPRLIIANHELGSFDVTRNDPVATTFFSGGNVNNEYRTRSQTTVQTGLIVEITPHISNRGLVELELGFENSRPIFVDN